MARTRLLLCASTILAGLCCPGLEPATAGPNTPSLSAPNIAPMRPELNMRAPDALRRGDTTSPRDVASSPRGGARPKATKSKATSKATAGRKAPGSASRATGAAGTLSKTGQRAPTVGNPVDGGTSPQTGNRNQLEIPAGLEEFFKAFGGNPEAWSRIKELAELIKLGPNGFLDRNPMISGGRDAADPLSRPPFGSDPRARHEPGSGWNPFGAPDGRPSGARGQPGEVGMGTGWNWVGPKASRDENGTETVDYVGYNEHSGRTTWVQERRHADGSSDETTISRDGGGDTAVTSVTRSAPRKRADGTMEQFVVFRRFDSEPNGSGATRYRVYSEVEEIREPTARQEKNDPIIMQPGPKPDSNPNEFGGYTGPIVCPLGGCRDESVVVGPQTNPGPQNPEGSSTNTTHRGGPATGPGAATDPCPDCGPSGGGGTRVSRPSDVGWGGPGVPGGEGGATPGPRGAGSTGAGGTPQ